MSILLLFAHSDVSSLLFVLKEGVKMTVNCKNCKYFKYNRFYCSKLNHHVYLTDKCCYFKENEDS